jgi:polysaccharide biosynthesis/export protein
MKSSRTIYALVFLSLVVTTPCSGTTDMTSSPSKASAEKAPAEQAKENSSLTSSLTVTTDYILGPEDVLEINVWKNADLSKQVQVRPDGRISLPLIGDVPLASRPTWKIRRSPFWSRK